MPASKMKWSWAETSRRNILYEFEYLCPATVESAVADLDRDDARALAGGTDLVPQMREGRRHVTRVVDLKRIAELTGITGLVGGGVSIGAAASATAVSRHPVVAGSYPAIARSACLIGGVQVQNRATLGGNICNGAPSADAVPALLVHEARVVVASTKERREAPLEALLRGPGRTALGRGEMLAAVVLPPPPPRSAACYLRFTPRREMDIAVAGAAALVALDENGAIASARIVLASVAPTAIRARSAEAALLGERPSDALFSEAGRLAAQDARPISDTRGSAEYRRRLVAVLVERALADCRSQLQVRSRVA
jgi:CO/xanthine dehydrogenase FAD-binding subunit